MDASSSDMLGGTMTQSPGWEQADVRGGNQSRVLVGSNRSLWKVRCTFQSAGVATRLLAVSCRESTARKISSKLRPVVAG